MTSQEQRNDNLLMLATVVVDQMALYKIDKIADVYIHNSLAFTAFRRYNSVHEYVIEYVDGNTYVQKNGTIRHSLEKILYLPKDTLQDIYTRSVYSYKHNAKIEKLEVSDLTWNDIVSKYGAICVNFGGILYDNQSVQTPPRSTIKKQPPNAPQRPRNLVINPDRQIPRRRLFFEDSKEQTVNEEVEPWAYLIPKNQETLKRPLDHDDNICYCYYEQENVENTSDDLVLRNGRHISKKAKK